jgi:hypothetical protein
MDDPQLISKDILEILKKIRDGKIYGSVEIYFEDGEVTQITQRIIKKVSKKKYETQRQTGKSPQFTKKTNRMGSHQDPVDLPANSY